MKIKDFLEIRDSEKLKIIKIAYANAHGIDTKDFRIDGGYVRFTGFFSKAPLNESYIKALEILTTTYQDLQGISNEEIEASKNMS